MISRQGFPVGYVPVSDFFWMRLSSPVLWWSESTAEGLGQPLNDK